MSRSKEPKERGKAIISGNVYALMREGAQNTEKRQHSHNIFGEYTHQMRNSIRVQNPRVPCNL